MEMSHRSAEYQEINQQAVSRLKQLTGAGEGWEVLFLQGGASSQFMMVPFNFLGKENTADYIDTGVWSAKAIKEASGFGTVHVPFSGKRESYSRIPTTEEITISEQTNYVHFTSNNTIYGTQFSREPDSNGIPLVCDASSDFLSRPIDLEKYGLIYAGAQKNLGPAGVTVVMIRRSFMDRQASNTIPTILNYKTHLDDVFNTPPVFAVYLVNYVLEWIQEKGGLPHFETFNTEKAALLYREIDKDEFYRGTVEKESRSNMNVTFRLKDPKLEQTFIKEAASHRLMNLKGHRSAGGIRASIYNACERESVLALTEFMNKFRNKYG